MTKKIISLLICMQLFFMPAFAVDTEYDFSDEAQQRFEQSHKTIPVQNNDFSKRQTRKEIKKQIQEEKNLIFDKKKDRTNYTPIVDIPQVIAPKQQETLSGSIISVPRGESFYATFDSGLSSGSMDKNDRITARLTDDWIYNGIMLAPAGSLIYGSATAAKSAGLAYGTGSLEITFNKVMLPNGNMINIVSKPIQLSAKSKRAQNITRNVLIGAATTMLIGAVFTAIGGGGDDWGRNMIVAGSIGAAGGGIRSLTQRGEDVYIPNGTNVEIILTEPINISPYN